MTGKEARILLAAALALSLGAGASLAGAEEKAGKKVLDVGRWYPSAEAGINLTQSAYSDNWAGGDKGSVVWVFNGKAAAENQLDPKVNWNSILKLAYGQTHRQSSDSGGRRGWDRPEKSTDLVDLETLFRFTLGGFVDPFFAGRFESQFQDASDPAGRLLSLNPLKFKETAGIAKQLVKEENRELLTRFGFAFRQNSRRAFTDSVGTSTATESTNDGGLEWVTDFKTKTADGRLAWTSKLTLTQPVFFSGDDEFDGIAAGRLAAAGIAEDVADYPKALDADFENILTNQITKIISVSLYTRWVYDKYDNSVLPKLNDAGDLADPGAVRAAVRKSGQFKQTLSLGITYRFL
jgi:hypothetical protein